MSHRGTNSTPNTIQHWNGRHWQQPAAIPNIYVDGVGGSDNNTGLTVGDPLATLKAALRLASFSTVLPTISVARGVYDPEGLDDQSLAQRPCEIVGTDSDVLVGSLVLSDYNSVSRTLTFAPSPGWTVNQFAGYFLRRDSGANPVFPINAIKLIHSNGGDSVQVCGVSLGEGGQAPQVGDIYSIVEPAAKITAARGWMAVGGPGITRRQDGNGNLSTQTRRLINIDIELQGSNPLDFSGSFDLDGVRIVSFGASANVNFSFGQFSAGEFLNAEGLQGGRFGWGLASIIKGTGQAPVLTFNQCDAYVMTATGRVTVKNATLCWLGGSMRSASSVFPHGTLCALEAGHVYTPAQAQVGRFRLSCTITGINDAHIVSEGAGALLETDAALVYEGNARAVRVRYHSVAKIGTHNPTFEGTGNELYAEMGGHIRLNGINGSTFGDALAGGSAALGQVIRPAGAWAAGDAVCTFANFPKDLSNIYRSS